MQRFKSILVVIDRNTDREVLVKRAVTLAHRNQAHLNVITFSEELPPEMNKPLIMANRDDQHAWINYDKQVQPCCYRSSGLTGFSAAGCCKN